MDGEKTSPDRWEESRAGLLRYNREQLQAVCRILARQDSFHGDLMESALWPLCVGPQEAEAFLENPEAFDLWLHEKQSVDAFYSQPKYYQRAGEAIGVYSICEEFRCIFPRDPAEAAQAMEALKRGHKAALVGANSAARTNLNPVTGSPWALEDFRVLFLSYQEDRKLGVNRYQDFLDRLPPEKFSPYDATHILIEPMTTEELQAYFEL